MKMKLFSKKPGGFARKKPAVLMASLLTVLCITVGGTLAYLVTQTDPVTNTFVPSKVQIEMDETIANNTKRDVKIANTGDAAVYIRAAVVVTWQDVAGAVYSKVPVAGTDYTVTWNAGADKNWQRGSDGFYYFKQLVEVGESTDVLIASCAPVADKAPEGYSLAVEIIASAIQAEGHDSKGNKPVELAWGVDIDGGQLKAATIVQ